MNRRIFLVSLIFTQTITKIAGNEVFLRRKTQKNIDLTDGETFFRQLERSSDNFRDNRRGSRDIHEKLEREADDDNWRLFDLSLSPTMAPTNKPTSKDTSTPSISKMPSSAPSIRPTNSSPTLTPSLSPSAKPLTSSPTLTPSLSPSAKPLTSSPTLTPSLSPSAKPLTSSPTLTPSLIPSSVPSITSTTIPSKTPTKPPQLFLTIEPTQGVFVDKCNITVQDRRNLILSVLNTVSEPSALSTSGTPQNTAAEWLISEDEEVRCPDNNQLVQRYVMALFYFSTNGDDWIQCGRNDGSCGTSEPFIGRDNYLSGSHECNWAGLFCDNDLNVIALEYELNNVAGVLPFELEQLESLELLVLEQGVLTGTIPPQLGGLPALKQLDLCGNSFTGTIPEELYGISTLEIFELDMNQLEGTISNSIGNLVNLQLLQLQGNSFTGTIPASLGNLNLLIVADFFQNEFTGVMPTEICDIRLPPIGTGILTGLTTDCLPNAVTGVTEVTCSCCSECFSA